jgi:uncharacterized protein (TIGR02231 family)
MRALCLFLATVLPATALADRVESPMRIDTVTVFPDLAQVDRVVRLDLPAGRHEVIVPNLPAGLDPAMVRVDMRSGGTLRSSSLLTDRIPPATGATDPALTAAKDAVTQLERRLAKADADIAAIRLQSEAARETIAFLRGLAGGAAEGRPPEALRDLARMVGAESLLALQKAHAAEQAATDAQIARADLEKELESARAALAELTTGTDDRTALMLGVEAAGGPVDIAITTYTSDAAGWAPLYDLHLSTEGEGTLRIDRALQVAQDTGEDWVDVTLTLSTAQDIGRGAPYTLHPRLLRAEKPAPVAADTYAEGAVLIAEEPPLVAAAAPYSVDFAGLTALYRYPDPVTLRSGAGDLRLPLDSATTPAETYVLAIPRHEDRGFVMARVTNPLPDPLLPGAAVLFRDGALIGMTELATLAPGAEVELGFGNLPGFELRREVPDRSEGGRGVLTKATERSETAILHLRNLTPRDWPVVVRDQVPYSEQEDLEITFTATPPETTRDAKGERGLLEWHQTLAAGADIQIRLDSVIRWPEGLELR